jgi:hypothetical protein
LAKGLQRRQNVFARASAGVYPLLSLKLRKCLLVKGSALALPRHWLVGVQTAGCQLAQDDVARTGHAPRLVYIFHANEPRAAMRASI